MDLEIPCRDTDPVENASMEVKVEPLAFTIDFGDDENLEEKAQKFERFAQRSSQRKVKSPRQDKCSNEPEGTNIEKSKHYSECEDRQRSKMFNREKSNLARAGGTSRCVKEKNVCSRNLSGIKKLNIQDKIKVEKDKLEVNDEVTSHTGTYTMEEEEEMKQVKYMLLN